MLKKTVLLVCVLVLCGSVQAANLNFDDGDLANSLWGTVGNWETGVIPLATDNPHILRDSPGAIIPNGYTAVGSSVFMGVGGWANSDSAALTVEAGGTLNVFGLNLAAGGGVPVDATLYNNGTITATAGISVGYQSADCVGTFNQNGGTASTDSHILLGVVAGSTGTLNLNNGTVTNGGMFVIGHAGPVGAGGSIGTLNMIGGTLNSNQWFQVGYRGTGTANISGGTINTGSGFGARIGEGGTGRVNMTGGILNANKFNIGTFAGGTGHLQLDGGTINAQTFEMGELLGAPGGVATMDINGDGKLIISGNHTALIQGYINRGLITTAQGGRGTVEVDYNDPNTVVSAPVSPTLVAPAPSGVGDIADLSPTVEWIPVDVSEVNPITPPVRTAQYLNYTTDPNLGIIASVTLGPDETSYMIPGPLAGLTTYYWSVDTDLNPGGTLLGPYWSFVTASLAPQIGVYDNVITATGLLPAVMSATVTDLEGDLVSAAFSATDPNVTLQNEDVSDLYAPTVEVLTAQEGTYVITLTVTDSGANVTVDTAEVSVYDDACEAAQAAPSWADFNYFDYDLDCKLDLTDFSEFAYQWLDDITLQAQETY